MCDEENRYLVADDTLIPYEEWENPFVRTEEDDAFDLQIAEKFGLTIEMSKAEYNSIMEIGL